MCHVLHDETTTKIGTRAQGICTLAVSPRSHRTHPPHQKQKQAKQQHAFLHTTITKCTGCRSTNSAIPSLCRFLKRVLKCIIYGNTRFFACQRVFNLKINCYRNSSNQRNYISGKSLKIDGKNPKCSQSGSPQQRINCCGSATSPRKS